MDKKDKQIKAMARMLVKQNGMPETWADRLDFDASKPVEDQMKDLAEEYKSIRDGDAQEERSTEDWAKLMNEEDNVGRVDLT
ncbi:hypothetical protein [uncultured Draconibacterium sp.]|uniref:hypothetical protein n=1 Tax=uncultured Draconibacterium sp. TaxID=1573823 RepID=UPI0029C95511|nr:hypothetical protein [uncultured Draconibacterium sp.]